MAEHPMRVHLRWIVREYGISICSDALRCKALLNDLSEGQYIREVNLLLISQSDGVPTQIAGYIANMPIDSLLDRLTSQMVKNRAIEAIACRWAVESWALALGRMSESEVTVESSITPAQSVAPSVVVPVSKVAPVSPSVPVPASQKSIKAPALLEMVLIPAGSFLMGSNERVEERPVRRVTLSAFHMSKNVVTVGDYKRYCESTGTSMPDAPSFNPNWSKLEHPIVNVSWNDAKGYCVWAGVDLPREAEWEYASRGGLAGKKYPWGDTWDKSKCANSAHPNQLHGTVIVGSYPANAYGLYDMSGNVREWCSDWYHWYQSTSSIIIHKLFPHGSDTGTDRVLRGGSWSDFNPAYLRCAYRGRHGPDYGYNDIGFRVVFRDLS